MPQVYNAAALLFDVLMIPFLRDSTSLKIESELIRQRHNVETHFMVETFPRSPFKSDVFSWSAGVSLIFPRVPAELVLIGFFEATSLFGGPLRDSELGGEAHGLGFT